MQGGAGGGLRSQPASLRILRACCAGVGHGMHAAGWDWSLLPVRGRPALPLRCPRAARSRQRLPPTLTPPPLRTPCACLHDPPSAPAPPTPRAACGTGAASRCAASSTAGGWAAPTSWSRRGATSCLRWSSTASCPTTTARQSSVSGRRAGGRRDVGPDGMHAAAVTWGRAGRSNTGTRLASPAQRTAGESILPVSPSLPACAPCPPQSAAARPCTVYCWRARASSSARGCSCG